MILISSFFGCLPFSFIFPVVSRLFQACPHSARAPFSPSPSPPSSSLLLSVSISPILYAFRFPARSSGWISPPSRGKIPEKTFSCPSSTQILLQLLGLALHCPLLPKHNSTHLWNLHPPSWVDNFGLFGFFFFLSFSGSGLLGATALPKKHSYGLLLLSWPRTSGICQPCSTFDPPSIIPHFPTLSLRDSLPVFSKYLISCESK